jgi:arylsulfatase A-like enzyme
VAAALLVVAAGTSLAWWLRSGTGPADGPIIFISIDTLRADHLPAYGYTQVRTPAIDALAGDGVLFERAYAHSPQTLPSHASILSARSADAAGTAACAGIRHRRFRLEFRAAQGNGDRSRLRRV